MNISNARSKLFELVDKVATEHKPVLIEGKRNNAVLVSEEDWNSIQETLYLLSVPGMRESLKRSMEEPLDECAEEIEW